MTKTRETLKKHTHTNTTTTQTAAKQHREDKGHNPHPKATALQMNPLAETNTVQGAKVYNLTKVAKHPPEQPTNHDGKASA